MVQEYQSGVKKQWKQTLNMIDPEISIGANCICRGILPRLESFTEHQVVHLKTKRNNNIIVEL